LKITANDVDRGHLRVTQEPKRRLELPEEPAELRVSVRGAEITCKWNPTIGPDRNRSGLLRLGRELMRRTWTPPAEATISRSTDGTLIVE
jgi:hypothetical protein